MTDQDVQPAVLGEHGEPCQECGAPQAADQRYCLNCGRRRAGPRVDYRHYMGLAESGSNGARPEPAAASPESSGEEKKPERDYAPFAAVGGIAVLGLMLLVGVLIGKGNNTTSSPPAPMVQLKQPGAGATEGESGKSEATSAKPGKKKSEKVDTGAKRVKGGLTGAAKNSDATVQASKGELEDLGEATGEAYEEAQKKLPDKIATPGAPPPIDKSKAPGAGGNAETIE